MPPTAVRARLLKGEIIMTLKECYEKLGGDYDDALSRMMNDVLIDKFIIKFLDDRTIEEFKAAVQANDIIAIFRASHTMKGVAGNLGFTRLAAAASDLTEHVRGRETGDVDTALVQEFNDAYDAVCTAVRAYMAEK